VRGVRRLTRDGSTNTQACVRPPRTEAAQRSGCELILVEERKHDTFGQTVRGESVADGISPARGRLWFPVHSNRANDPDRFAYFDPHVDRHLRALADLHRLNDTRTVAHRFGHPDSFANACTLLNTDRHRDLRAEYRYARPSANGHPNGFSHLRPDLYPIRFPNPAPHNHRHAFTDEHQHSRSRADSRSLLGDRPLGG